MGGIIGSTKQSYSGGCKLFKKYQHCCRFDCFGPAHQQTEDALLSALRIYNADYLLSTIMEYVPDAFSTTKVISIDDDYYSYTYESLSQNVENIKIPPCNVWLKMKWPSDDSVPEFKVCVM